MTAPAFGKHALNEDVAAYEAVERARKLALTEIEAIMEQRSPTRRKSFISRISDFLDPR